MLYREFAPSAESRHFIQALWTLEQDGADAQPQRVIPDGHPELILNLGEPFEVLEAGAWRRQPRCFLAGQIADRCYFGPTGLPGSWGSGFIRTARRTCGVPHGRADGPVHSGCGSFYRSLDKALHGDSSIHSVEAALLLAARNAKPDLLAAEAIRRIGLARGSSKLSELARDLGVSVRQFERRFRTAVGLSPKLYCRLQRFTNVFQVLGDGGGVGWMLRSLAAITIRPI